jgi:hypothetical protein
MNDIVKKAMISAFVKACPLTVKKIDENLDGLTPVLTARHIAAMHAKNAGKTPDQLAAMVKYAQVYAEQKIAERKTNET